MKRRCLRFALMLACALAPLAAHAVVRVFATPSPSVETYQGVLNYGPVSRNLTLWVEIGTNPHVGIDCKVGINGDEVCGYDVEIEIEGGGYITGFTAATATRWWPTNFACSPPNCVRKLGITFVRVAAQPQVPAEPLEIGTISVNGTPAGGTRVLANGQLVLDAGLQPRVLPSDTTLATLPEPGVIASLICGALGVALLSRLRRVHER